MRAWRKVLGTGASLTVGLAAILMTMRTGAAFPMRVVPAQVLRDQSQDQSSDAEPAPPAFTIEMLDSTTQLPGELGALPILPEVRGNPLNQAKVELGRLLFQDKRLSVDHSISCAACHDPARGFSDGRERAVGIGHKVLPRRSPSLLNDAYNSSQFWDGRASSLEAQAGVPILAVDEMGMPNAAMLVERLHQVREYRQRFRAGFGREINFEDIKKAIAAYERTLVTPDSPFDRYAGGDKQALTDRQKRGLILFFGKAACTECHNGPNFTDNKFHSLGLLPGERKNADVGRFALTGNPGDRHAFKTPSLRSATLQSAYMHNGSIATLSEVIEFYRQGGGSAPKSKLVFRLELSASDKEDLLMFLQSLRGHLPTESERLTPVSCRLAPN